MNLPRISASSYSNTAPLVWSFLYGSQRGRVEVILDNAPARSAELLATERVDAALVPVIAYQTIGGLSLVRDVCVGAENSVRSVCLVTGGSDLRDVRSVALDVSSKTSVALTKIVFREFLGAEPEWRPSEPVVSEMLADADCALLIGDPALTLSARTDPSLRVFDLAELWNNHTGLGFVFAMWMARKDVPGVDFRAARDEGLRHTDDIIANYLDELPLDRDEFRNYLTDRISYSVSEKMADGLELFFRLCEKHGVTEAAKPLRFI